MISDSGVITATIPEFRRLSGISRSKIYKLLDERAIESVYIGARRLIVVDSYRKLIQQQRTSQAATSERRSDDRPTA